MPDLELQLISMDTSQQIDGFVHPWQHRHIPRKQDILGKLAPCYYLVLDGKEAEAVLRQSRMILIVLLKYYASVFRVKTVKGTPYIQLLPLLCTPFSFSQERHVLTLCNIIFFLVTFF